MTSTRASALVLAATALVVLAGISAAAAEGRAGSSNRGSPSATSPTPKSNPGLPSAASPPPKPTGHVLIPPLPGPLPQRPAGILHIAQGPLPAGLFLATDSWQGPITPGSSSWYIVWAGSKGNGEGVPRTPAVMVYISTATPAGWPVKVVGTFTQPDADGPLTIVAANGTVLELQTPSGHAYYFDVATDRYE